MLKYELIEAYKSVVTENKFTYTDLCKLTGFSPSQVANILRHDGKLVSIEKMIDGLDKMGFGVEFNFYHKEEG